MAAPICLTLAGGPNTLNIRPRVDMREKTFDFSWYNPTYTRPVWLLNRAGSRDRKRHGTLIHCSLPITKCKSHNYGSCQLIIAYYAY